MSGGTFDFQDRFLKGKIFGFTDTPTDPFHDKLVSDLVWDVFDLVQAYDWFLSGDNGEYGFTKDLDTFKKKWLSVSQNKENHD